MNDVLETLTIMFSCLVVITVVLGSIFGLFAYMRYLRHKEILTLAEKGLSTPDFSNAPNFGMLRWGIVITGLGIALCLGLYPFGWIIPMPSDLYMPLRFGPWMLIGLLPTFFGVSLIVAYVALKRVGNGETKHSST